MNISNPSRDINWQETGPCYVCKEMDDVDGVAQPVYVHEAGPHPIHTLCLRTLQASIQNQATVLRCGLCRREITHVNSEPVPPTHRMKLITAATQGDRSTLLELVRSSENPEESRGVALCIVSEGGDFQTGLALLASGSVSREHLAESLVRIARYGDTEFAEELLVRGPIPDTAIRMAGERGEAHHHPAFCKVLETVWEKPIILERGQALFEACRQGHLHVASLLLEKNLAPTPYVIQLCGQAYKDDGQELLTKSPYFPSNLLKILKKGRIWNRDLGISLCEWVKYGDLAIFQKIMESGFISFFHIEQAMEEAIRHKQPAILEILRIEKRGLELIDALKKRRLDIAWELLRGDAMSNHKLSSALRLAIHSRCPEIALALVERSYLSPMGKGRFSSIMNSIGFGYPELALALLRKYPPPDGNHLEKYLQAAVRSESCEVVFELCKHLKQKMKGFSLSGISEYLHSEALLFAIQKGHLPTVEAILAEYDPEEEHDPNEQAITTSYRIACFLYSAIHRASSSGSGHPNIENALIMEKRGRTIWGLLEDGRVEVALDVLRSGLFPDKYKVKIFVLAASLDEPKLVSILMETMSTAQMEEALVDSSGTMGYEQFQLLFKRIGENLSARMRGRALENSLQNSDHRIAFVLAESGDLNPHDLETCLRAACESPNKLSIGWVLLNKGPVSEDTRQRSLLHVCDALVENQRDRELQFALFERLMQGITLSDSDRGEAFVSSVRANHAKIFYSLLQSGNIPKEFREKALAGAVEMGNLEFVSILRHLNKMVLS